jgi:hypothetical protein
MQYFGPSPINVNRLLTNQRLIAVGSAAMALSASNESDAEQPLTKALERLVLWWTAYVLQQYRP